MEDKVTIHEKARGETINVYIEEFAGKKYLHVREWYLDKDGTEKPSKKGVAVPLEKVEALMEAVKKMMADEEE